VTKVEGYREVLAGLLDAYLTTSKEKPLADYLTANSNLPGPRGNLELAQAFADAVRERANRSGSALWDLCLRFAQASVEQAPVNTAAEFLPFCGARGLAALGTALPDRFERALERLHVQARDARWRTREGVAMGLQDLIASNASAALHALGTWIQPADWLAMRAVAAGVAEPRLLHESAVAAAALELHRRIIAAVLGASDRKSPEFKALRQGLGYSLSVVVAAAPEQGFAYLTELAASPDEDAQWILRENLKKNRLAKPLSRQVLALQRTLKSR
jgi:hypothetical protein